MKAERRHELKENDLAHALSVARNYIDQNGGRIGIFILIFFGAIIVVSLTVRSRAAAIEDVWRRRSQLKFEDVATGKQALQSLNTMILDISDERFIMDSLIEISRQALRLAKEVPDSPDRELTEIAQNSLFELQKKYPDNAMALGVALNGLASVEQNLFLIDYSSSHKNAARNYLQKILDTKILHSTPFQRIAADRLAAIDSVFIEVTLDYPPPPEPEDTKEDDLEKPGTDQAEQESVDKP